MDLKDANMRGSGAQETLFLNVRWLLIAIMLKARHGLSKKRARELWLRSGVKVGLTFDPGLLPQNEFRLLVKKNAPLVNSLRKNEASPTPA